MSSIGFAAPPAESAPETLALTITGNALARTQITPDTPVQLSPRQATLRVRAPGHPDLAYHLLHSTHRPVQYSLWLSDAGELVKNYYAVVSRDGGQTWEQLPLGAYSSDKSLLPWQVSIRGYEQVIVEVRQNCDGKAAEETTTLASEKQITADNPGPGTDAPQGEARNTQLEQIISSLESITKKINDIDNTLKNVASSEDSKALKEQIATVNDAVTEIKSSIQTRRDHVQNALANFLLSPDSVRVTAKAQISGESFTQLDWVTHPTNLRISGPKTSAGIALPAPPISAEVTFWLKSSAHPQGQKLISLPARFSVSGDELFTDIGFQQTIASPLEAALIANQCPPGRYHVAVQIELNSGSDKLTGICGNVVVLEITP